MGLALYFTFIAFSDIMIIGNYVKGDIIMNELNLLNAEVL